VTRFKIASLYSRDDISENGLTIHD